MTPIRLVLLAACVALMGSCGYVLTIVNGSSQALVGLYMATSQSGQWGGNLLERDLPSGERFDIRGTVCGDVDVRVVAEDGRGCTLVGVTFCDDSAAWIINDQTLDTCSDVVGPPASGGLTVELDGLGSVAVEGDQTCAEGPCEYEVGKGEEVGLTAVPDTEAGSRFDHWAVDCTGAEATTRITGNGQAQTCTAVFRTGVSCDDPLELTLELSSPADACETEVVVDGLTYPALEVDAYEAVVQARYSHPLTSIAWAVPLQDPTAPDFQDSNQVQQTLDLFPGSVMGAAVQVIDTCTPARTAEAILLVRQGDGICP